MLTSATIENEMLTQDQRMSWWRQSRFGMFIHWGLYALPAGEWGGKEIPNLGEWIMHTAKIPVTEYRKLAAQFNPQKFDARSWVQLAKAAGMKYVTITAKHHDGFAMYHSKASTYNIVDATPFGRDPIKELADECHRQGLRICFYYSQVQDWNEAEGFANDWDFPQPGNFQKYLDEKVKPQLTELLTQYGPVGMIWFDTPYNITAEQAQPLKDLVRKLQPACIISGRLGGGVATDYYSTGDNVVPGSMLGQDWEVPATLNNTWGFKQNDHNWKSVRQLLIILFDIVAKGGNYLLNVGPTADGLIPQESIDILQQMGQWMTINQECIYGSQASPFNEEFPWGNITRKGNVLYLGFYQWPGAPFYLEGLITRVQKIWLLADASALNFQQTINEQSGRRRLLIDLPGQAPDAAVSVVAVQLEAEPQVQTGIHQQGDGAVLLSGIKGLIRKHSQKAQLNFGSRTGGSDGWLDPEITITWRFNLEKAGRYRLDIVTMETGSHGNPAWIGGHRVAVDSEHQQQTCTIVANEKKLSPRTVYWNKVYTYAGEIEYSQAGEKTLRLSPCEIKDDIFEGVKPGFTFKEILLTPA